jgi:hypothetical protein
MAWGILRRCLFALPAVACLYEAAFAADLAATPPNPIAGLAVQVSEGGTVPTLPVLNAFLPPGASVRDVLSWASSEQTLGHYAVPDGDWRLYAAVASVGGKNVVTLFTGNLLYQTNGTFGFPTTPAQIQGFANFAAWAVRNDGTGAPNQHAANIPALYAVTIWNEMNGTWNGGIHTGQPRWNAMAALLNVVVPRIRAENPSVHIAAGAFIGYSGVARWFRGIGQNFDWSTVDWLDIHPYLATSLAATQWGAQVSELRVGEPLKGVPGIKNPLYFSEWGGVAAANYTVANPNGISYFDWFQTNVVGADRKPIAGGNYFTLYVSRQFPREGLVHAPLPNNPTRLGVAFQQAFLP